jgi:dolichol-phosphate mannosyltransferase
MKAVVILPTYNERENIIILLDRLSEAAKKIKNHTLKYLVVDDNSPDGTQEVVNKYARIHPNVYLICGIKQGLGMALLRGMEFAAKNLKADIIIQMDADLSHDPNRMPYLIDLLDKGYDFAVGSRYIKGGSIPDNWGIHRKIFSICSNLIVRYGLGYPNIRDWTGGYRAYKSVFYQKSALKMAKYSGYVFQIAFLHQSLLAGAKVGEVPIQFVDRKFGKTKIIPSEYIRKVFEYVIVNLITRIIKGSFGKFLVVGSIGFIINTIILELMVRFHYNPAIGSAVGAECAIVSNFILNNSWTFKSKKVSGFKQIIKFIQFNLTSFGAVIIQSGTVWTGITISGVSMYRIWYMLGVTIGLVWNYSMYSRIIWKTR